MAEKIWKPDTFFVNEVSSESKQVLLRIKPSGEVLFSQRIVVCFVSAGNFRNFPWDVNLYTLDFESFGYTMEHFKYGWKDGNKSVQVAFDANVFGDLILAGQRTRKVEVSLTSGNYSRLLLDFCFTRHSGTAAQNIFIPVALITCLALPSLILPKSEVCAKTILLTTTTLAMIGLKTWLHSSLLHSVFYATRASVYVSLHLAVIVILNVNFFISQLLANIIAPSHEVVEIQMRRLEREDSSESSNPLLKTSTRLPCWAKRVEKILGWSPIPLFLLAQIGFWISDGSLSPEEEVHAIGDLTRVLL